MPLKASGFEHVHTAYLVGRRGEDGGGKDHFY